MTRPVLRARDVHVQFRQRSAGLFGKSIDVEVLGGIDLDIMPAETVGVLGESGCGKSTLARALAGLTRYCKGTIEFFDGNSESGAVPPSLGVQMVFQDPYSSLNPRRTIGETLSEGWKINRKVAPTDGRTRVANLLQRVGLPATYATRFPAGLSGGERQRVAIARALSVAPRVLICDEAVSALDATVKAQIIRLLRAVQEESGVSYLFISHDTVAVREVAARVVVMYLGLVVEEGRVEDVFTDPRHPYTRALLAAVPRLRPWREVKRRDVVVGEVDSFTSLGNRGCRFRGRCPIATDICSESNPELLEVSTAHRARCHFAREPLAAVRGVSSSLANTGGANG